MNFLNELIPENLISAFGWMILHSLWHGVFIALLLSISLLLLNRKTARVRYVVAVGAMLIFASLCVRTFNEYYNLNEIANKTESIANIDELVVDKLQPQSASITSRENLPIFESASKWFNDYFKRHLPLIVTIYLLGLLFLSLKLTGGYLFTQRIKHYRVNGAEEKYQKIVARLSTILNIDKRVKLVNSALVKVPVTIGYIKPVILFPIGTLAGMSYNQIEAILAHELAHIKRADYLVNFFQSVFEVLFFYHPAVWWISSVIREERENVCDDLAIDVCRKPVTLVKALVFVSEFEGGDAGFAMSSVGNKNKLIKRVKRLTGENKMKNLRHKAYAASLMLLVTLSFGFYACSSANASGYKQDNPNLVYKEKQDGDRIYVNTDRIDDDKRSYVFYKRWRGDRTKWDVTIEDNKIVDLYMDNRQIPKSEYYKYEDLIYDEVEDIEEDLVDLAEELDGLEEELVYLNDDLEDIKIEFDSDDFKKSMNELKCELKKLKKQDWTFDFDSEEFEKEMDEMREGLSNIEIDIDFDSDEFAEEMRHISHDLASIKVEIPDINIDVSGLAEGMKELEHELSNLDIDMSELKEEMGKFKGFMREAKKEMVKDGLVEKYDDIDNLEFDEDSMYLNYERVPDHLYNKYKEIYKKHFGKYPDDDSFLIN